MCASRVRTFSTETEQDGGCECDGGEEDGWASVVAGRDAPPVLEAVDHDLNAVAASVTALVVADFGLPPLGGPVQI